MPYWGTSIYKTDSARSKKRAGSSWGLPMLRFREPPKTLFRYPRAHIQKTKDAKHNTTTSSSHTTPTFEERGVRENSRLSLASSRFHDTTARHIIELLITLGKSINNMPSTIALAWRPSSFDLPVSLSTRTKTDRHPHSATRTM